MFINLQSDKKKTNTLPITCRRKAKQTSLQHMNLNKGEKKIHIFQPWNTAFSHTWKTWSQICSQRSFKMLNGEAASASSLVKMAAKSHVFLKSSVLIVSPHRHSEGQMSRESQSKSSWISSLLLCILLSGGRGRGVMDWGCIPAVVLAGCASCGLWSPWPCTCRALLGCCAPLAGGTMGE